MAYKVSIPCLTNTGKVRGNPHGPRYSGPIGSLSHILLIWAMNGSGCNFFIPGPFCLFDPKCRPKLQMTFFSANMPCRGQATTQTTVLSPVKWKNRVERHHRPVRMLRRRRRRVHRRVRTRSRCAATLTAERGPRRRRPLLLDRLAHDPRNRNYRTSVRFHWRRFSPWTFRRNLSWTYPSLIRRI